VEDRFAQIVASLERIDARLAKIETRENERRGAWVILVALGSILSGLGAWLVEHFWK
jgi:3-dehydroquinate dehydratase